MKSKPTLWMWITKVHIPRAFEIILEYRVKVFGWTTIPVSTEVLDELAGHPSVRTPDEFGAFYIALEAADQKLKDWCQANCKGKWQNGPSPADYHFQLKSDAVLFKLTWGG